MRKLSEYKSLVFDCDGVLLDSNKVKTAAFYNAALVYGEAPAKSLVEYHVENGGISRYKKFQYFLENIVKQSANEESLNELLDLYAKEVKVGLLECEVAGGLQALRDKSSEARWAVVSGGDQNELREIFAARNLADLFDAGIFGSPDTKHAIFAREIASGNISPPALFIGDSCYDYVAANDSGLDFTFVHEWSEFSGWQEFCKEKSVPAFANLADFFAWDEENLR